ncbi:MAG: hypothetical protein HYX87_07325 [Chloroflexi bacterium]|nr:hypothetical protein [Chloroflexota bacterium]
MQKRRGTPTQHAGVALTEALIALAMLGIFAAAFLGSLATGARGTIVANEKAMAESLARSEIEFVKSRNYQYLATEYPVNPDLQIPAGWSIPRPAVSPVHATDDGVQRFTVSVFRNGKQVLSITTYKVGR